MPELREGDVMAELVIRVRRDGAMSVSGSIHEEVYALAMLDAARDSIRGHHARQKLNHGGAVLIPSEASLAG